MSDEFRSVHEANEALKIYQESGKDISVIEAIPINFIKRYDVWECVFEKEHEAYRVLHQKEIYQLFKKVKDIDLKNRPSCLEMTATMAVHRMSQMIECHWDIMAEDIANIFLDTFGSESHNVLLKEAEESVVRRREIIAPYHKKDNGWVDLAVKALKMIEAINSVEGTKQ